MKVVPEALVQAGDLRAGLHAQLGVEVGERLVHEEDGRLAHDGATDGDALALAAGELARLAVEQVLAGEHVGRFLDAALDLGLGRLAQLQAEGHVVVHGHVRVERVGLEDHGDVAVLGGDVVDDPVADGQRALGDLLQAGEHAQRGGLAAARGADEDQELPVVDLDVEVVDGDDLTEALPDPVERDRSHS